MDRKEEKIKDLTNWLLQENTNCSICNLVSVEPTYYGGRGLFSTDKIKPKQRLIKISHPYLLNFTNILAHITSWGEGEVYNKMKLPEFPKKVDQVTVLYSQMDLNALLKLTSFQIVCLYICLELKRGENSWWVPFWNSLPPLSDFESSPLTWKLSGKSGKSLPRSTQRHCDKMYTRFMTDFAIVTELIKSLNTDMVITQEEFHWAWFCVNSRCLYMEIPESHSKADNFTMAPFVDLINHSPNEQCILKIDHSGFHVLTSTDYESNHEIYLSYGPHSNEFLLCEYGFMLTENPWNDVDLTDEVLSVLDRSQRDFLESKGYLGDYTMNRDDVSFRIEVALAVSLEQDGSLDENRRLKAFINGISDGKYYKRKSNEILMSILENLRDEHEGKLNGDEVVDALYKQQISIISHQLEKIQQDS
jgi:hypothetical protein